MYNNLRLIILIILIPGLGFAQQKTDSELIKAFQVAFSEIEDTHNRLMVVKPETTKWDELLLKLANQLAPFAELGAEIENRGLNNRTEVKNILNTSLEQTKSLQNKIKQYKKDKFLGSLKVGDCVNVRFLDSNEDAINLQIQMMNSQVPKELKVRSNGYIFQCEVVKITNNFVVVKVNIELGRHIETDKTGSEYVKNKEQNRYQINQIVKISNPELLIPCY